MSDSEQILPVIPILAYANPQSGQPAHGRLKVEYLDAGLVVTDPKSAATSPGVIKAVGRLLMFLGSVFAVINFLPAGPVIGTGDWPRGLGALCAVVCGVFCFFRAAKIKQDPRVLRVSMGRLYTTGCPGHDSLSGRFRVRKFILLRGSVDLKTRQSVHSIRVRYAMGFTFTLIPLLSQEEGIWAMELLQKALDKASV
jgi:uncharacterized integral membrane protein